MRKPRPVQLFGVVKSDLAGRRFIVEGRTASAVAYGNLALVIRDLDPGEWDANSLEQKLNDPQWVTRQASVHQRVLERAMHAGTVVPVRLWSVYENRQDLDQLVASNSERWRKALLRLADKQEWCLHVYDGPHVASHYDPYPLRIAPANGELPIEGAHAAHLGNLWKATSALASGTRRIEPLPNARYAFGATFLLRRTRLREFRSALMRFAVVARESGLTYYLDGPHPPFTFV